MDQSHCSAGPCIKRRTIHAGSGRERETKEGRATLAGSIMAKTHRVKKERRRTFGGATRARHTGRATAGQGASGQSGRASQPAPRTRDDPKPRAAHVFNAKRGRARGEGLWGLITVVGLVVDWLPAALKRFPPHASTHLARPSTAKPIKPRRISTSCLFAGFGSRR
jgi:hypothetical protein